MIRCGKIKGVSQCVLFSADGDKILGSFPFDEHGGEKGARAAAHKREGQVQAFKRMKKSIVDAVEEFGLPAVLKHVIGDALECESCEEIVKDILADALGIDGQDVEKARKKKRRVRRVTIEDEDDDEDDRDEGKEPQGKEEGPPEKMVPPKKEEPGEEEGGGGPPKEAEEEGEEEGPKREGPVAEPKGEGVAQGEGPPKREEPATEAGLPEGWTPESLQKYWQSLGGSVESCVKNAPKAARDPQRFCSRLQAKIGKLGGGGGEEEGEGPPKPPAPPMEKSIESLLEEVLSELVEKRAAEVKGVPPKGWNDPMSWMKRGASDQIRERAWRGMGSSVTGCMGSVKGKVGNPGQFCAALKDKILGYTKWRGKKKGKTEKSVDELVDDLILVSAWEEGEEVLKEIEWTLGGDEDWVEKDEGDGAGMVVPAGDIMIIDEGGQEVNPDQDPGEPQPVEEGPTFVDFIRDNHAKRMAVVVENLADQLAEEGE